MLQGTASSGTYPEQTRFQTIRVGRAASAGGRLFLTSSQVGHRAAAASAPAGVRAATASSSYESSRPFRVALDDRRRPTSSSSGSFAPAAAGSASNWNAPGANSTSSGGSGPPGLERQIQARARCGPGSCRRPPAGPWPRPPCRRTASRSRAKRSSGIVGAATVSSRANSSGSRSASGQPAGSPVSDLDRRVIAAGRLQVGQGVRLGVVASVGMGDHPAHLGPQDRVERALRALGAGRARASRRRSAAGGPRRPSPSSAAACPPPEAAARQPLPALLVGQQRDRAVAGASRGAAAAGRLDVVVVVEDVLALQRELEAVRNPRHVVVAAGVQRDDDGAIGAEVALQALDILARDRPGASVSFRAKAKACCSAGGKLDQSSPARRRLRSAISSFVSPATSQFISQCPMQ